MKTKLYLIRHCESLGNRQNLFQGQKDLDISEDGEKQLALLALRFRNIPLDAVYASPLCRAMKTAAAVNEFHHLPIQQDRDLMEIDVGRCSGQPLAELYRQYPQLAKQWNETPQDCVFPEGESTAQVYQRAQNALHRILSAQAGKTVAVVSHGFLLRNMVCALLEKDLNRLHTVHIGGNTSVTELDVYENEVRVIQMADKSHLPASLQGDPNQYVLGKGVAL